MSRPQALPPSHLIPLSVTISSVSYEAFLHGQIFHHSLLIIVEENLILRLEKRITVTVDIKFESVRQLEEVKFENKQIKTGALRQLVSKVKALR